MTVTSLHPMYGSATDELNDGVDIHW